MYYLVLSSLVIIGILGVSLIPFKFERILNLFSLYISILIFFCSIFLLSLCQVSINEAISFFFYKPTFFWFDLFFFDFQLGFDFLSYYMLLLSTFLVPVCIIVSWKSINYRKKEFLLLLFFIEFFLINSFMVFDLFLFYIFFESLLIPMFLIIGIWGSRSRKIRAAYQFFFYTLLGSLFMLLAIIYLYLEKGSTNLLVLYNSTFGTVEGKLLWLLFFFSFAIKIPMIPVHLWLPEAHVEAPTAGSVLLAGILLKLGGYGMIRFLLTLFPQFSLFFQPFVFLIGFISIFYSSLSTISQIDLKKIIAYSSIGHMNYVVLGIFSFQIEGLVGSTYMMLSHGFVSSGLFICIGFLYDRYHTRNIFEYGGLTQLMPLFCVFLFFFSFANFGFPGTSSFIGEFLILMGLSLSNKLLFFLASLSLLFSTVYSLWFLNRVCFGPLSLKIENYSDLNLREFLILFIFFFFVLFLGLYPLGILNSLYLNFDNIINFCYK